MTWGARTGRAALLSLLAVGWAAAAHLWSSAGDHPGPAAVPAHAGGTLDPVVVGALLWSVLAVALPAWWAAGAGRGAPGPRTGRLPAAVPRQQTGSALRRAGALGGVLLLGQALTHAALSVAPLLQGQSALLLPAAPGHEHHAPPVLASGAPAADQVLAAVLHGGVAMLLAHVGATALAAAAWALAGALQRAALSWWRRVQPRLVVRPLPRIVPVLPLRGVRAVGRPSGRYGRAPPRLAAA